MYMLELIKHWNMQFGEVREPGLGIGDFDR